MPTFALAIGNKNLKPGAKGNAEVAQLVEHNLAKVRVAGSSPVFRSSLKRRDARMVESVDTKDLKSFGYCSCAGSSPASSTKDLMRK